MGPFYGRKCIMLKINLSNLVVALYFFYAIMQLSFFNFSSGHLINQLQISGIQYGLLSSSYLYALALTLIPAGYILDRFKIKKIALITFFCLVMSSFFLMSSHLGLIFLYRAISGIANGFAFLICLRVAALYYSNKIATVSGLMISIGMLGGIFAPIVFSYLAINLDWNLIFIINAILGVVFLLVLMVFFKDKDDVFKHTLYSRQVLDLVAVVKNKYNWMCGFYTGFLNLSVYLIASLWGNLFLIQRYGLTNFKASIVSSMIFLGVIIGAPMWGYFSDRIMKKKMLMIFGAFFSLVFALLIVYFARLVFFELVILFFLIGISTSAQVISYPLIAELNSKKMLSMATGFVSLIINLVGAILQPIFAFFLTFNANSTIQNSVTVYSQKGLVQAFCLLPIAFLLAFMLSFFVRDQIRKNHV